MTKISEGPIVVSGTVLPATLAAAGRYIVAIATLMPVILSLLSRRDINEWVAFFKSSDAATLSAAVVGLATIGYGLFKTHKTKAQLVVTAEAAPNFVSEVKK